MVSIQNSNKKLQIVKNQNNVHNFILGGISGAISKSLIAPLQRVRLLFQTQKQNKKLKKEYKSIFQCISRTYHEQGIKNLWKGNQINIIRYSMTQGLAFMLKDSINIKLFELEQKKQTNKNDQPFIHHQQLINNIISGGLAGSIAAMILYPLDYGRTRISVDIGRNIHERQFRGFFHCIKTTFYHDGLRGLYRGWEISAISLFAYRGLYFGIYDTGKDKITNYYASNHFNSHFIDIMIKFIWAEFSVLTAQIISYPGDTIKRKMMMQSVNQSHQYKNIRQCINKVYKHQGFLGFWKGFSANLLTCLGTSMCLVFYDQIKKDYLTKRQNKKY